MRVHVYKHNDGGMSVLIEPSAGKGRPPVVLQGITAANVRERVLPELVAARAPKEPRRSKPPPG